MRTPSHTSPIDASATNAGPAVIRPNPLTSATVVRAAVQLADERGIEAVTMRGLGAPVGVGAMPLYNCVTGREALRDAMIADLLGQLTSQLRPIASPCTPGPAAYLERSARAVRNLALAHPWLIRLMVVRPPLDPTMSAPLANPAALACNRPGPVRAHLPPRRRRRSIQTFRSFCAFLLGHLSSNAVHIPGPVADLVETAATHLQDILTQPDHLTSAPAEPISGRHVA